MTTTTELRDLADWLPLLGLMRTSRPPLGVLQSERRAAPPPPDPAGSGRYPWAIDSTPAPVRLGTIDLEVDARAILSGWVRLAIEEGLTSDDWPADNSTAMTLWLHRNAHLLDEHMAGGEFADEIHTLWYRIRNAIGERPARRPRCTRVVDGQHCGWRVQGIDSEGEVSDLVEQWTWCRCPGCGATYTFDAALQRLGQLQSQTLRQWAVELGHEYDALRKRVQRAGLIPDGRDRRGQALYDRATVALVTSERMDA